MARIVNSQENKIKNIIKPKKSLSDLGINIKNTLNTNNKIVENSQFNNHLIEKEEYSFEEFQNLYGSGFVENEYLEMNKRFETLKNNYPLKTEMHKEALITYVKYAYKRDKAIADDDMDASDKWGKLAAKQANDAKINPSQLSAADLSGGMTCFAQVSATVEKSQDIIQMLNKFIEQPQDRVDYTIWQYINYSRHLEGKPLIQYKELYLFLNKRYEENKNKYKFLKKEEDGKFDDNDLGDE